MNVYTNIPGSSFTFQTHWADICGIHQLSFYSHPNSFRIPVAHLQLAVLTVRQNTSSAPGKRPRRDQTHGLLGNLTLGSSTWHRNMHGWSCIISMAESWGDCHFYNQDAQTCPIFIYFWSLLLFCFPFGSYDLLLIAFQPITFTQVEADSQRKPNCSKSYR